MIMLQAPQPLAGSCVLSENGKYVAGIVRGSPSGKVIVWRLPEDYTKNELTGTLVTEVSHGAYVTGVCIDETLNTLYTAGGDLITSWCLDDGKELQCFEGHVGEIRSLSIISRPLVLGSSGADGVKLWRTDIGAEFFTVPLPESTKDLYPHLMQYINKNLYLCDLRGNLYVVNTETREIATLGIDNPNASQVFNFMMDPINDLMAIVNAAAEVKTYKISTGEEVATKSVSSNVLTSGGGIFSTSNTMRER
jgi:WD40 repeat protein